jgi:hypothetical protein
LTEGQVRDILRHEIQYGTGELRLEQLGFIKKMLTGLFKGLGSLIAKGFEVGSSTYDPSKYGLAHAGGKSDEELSPRTNAYDQVYALSRVMWQVGSATELSLQTAEIAAKGFGELEFPINPDDEKFVETLEQATDWVGQTAGRFKEWLGQTKSTKVSEIGAGLEPGETVSGTLENLAEAIKQLESLNPEEDWENIVGSEAVQSVLKTKGEKADQMQNLINQTKSESLAKIKQLPELKSAIDQSYQIAVKAQQALDASAEEGGEKPEDSALLDESANKSVYISKSQLRKLIQESIITSGNF